MRKTITLAAAACLAVSLFGGSAVAGKKAQGRTVSFDYSHPNAFSTGPGNVAVYAQDINELKVFKTKRSEDTLSVNVEDASGTTVAGTVYQNGDLIDRFCGPEKNIKLPGGKNVIIEIYGGACEDGTPSVVTQGTITATFIDLR